MARGRVLVAGGLAACAVLLTAASGAARDSREGGTFRVAVPLGAFDTIDPALRTRPAAAQLLRPACGTLMAYPDKPLPEGYRLRPELAEAEPVASNGGRTYTFTIRKDARFSNGAPVTARAFARAIERVLTPALRSPLALPGLDIVGAKEFIDGKATTVSGVVARGRTFSITINHRAPDLPSRMPFVCAVPPSLPADPEGAKAPLPSAGPYYVAEYVPNARLVLRRNRFYRGTRPHHVDRIVASLGSDALTAVDQVARGAVEWAWLPSAVLVERAAELARRYGVNESQFFVKPGLFLRMFHLNTSRPLFRKNPKLRQAVNFAADRRALIRELGGALAGTPTDQFLLPQTPGFRTERIYPLERPNLARARALARGHTRGRRAVLYTRPEPAEVAHAQVLQRNLKAIGLEVEIQQFPFDVLLRKLGTPGEPWDITRIGIQLQPDPFTLDLIFHGRTVGQPGSSNLSYFDSPKFNRLLDEAMQLSGAARYRAYGDVDVQLSRDAAPAIPVAILNELTFVSAKVGCIVLNPTLDLTAVCLK